LRQKLKFVLEENRVCRALIDRHSPRWRLQDAERKVLAEKGKLLGKLLGEVVTIVKLETLLKWHRQLVAGKWDFSLQRKTKLGRPPVSIKIEKLVPQFARENPSRVYDRIVGALANLRHQISDQTVGNILKRHGLAKMKWKDGRCCRTEHRTERMHSRLRQARRETARTGRKPNHRGACVGLAERSERSQPHARAGAALIWQ
jgi:hypothetical protein